MPLKKGSHNSGIKNLIPFPKGKSGYHFKPREVKCVQCKSNFIAKGPLAKYCSSRCKENSRPDSQKNDFFCEFCGIQFKRRAKDNAGRFCSRQCSGMYTTATGKLNYFYKAFLYYDHECDKCGINDYELLCVHHIDYNHYNNDIENLQILCANCHYRIHFGAGRTRKEKLDTILNFLRRKKCPSPKVLVKK